MTVRRDRFPRRFGVLTYTEYMRRVYGLRPTLGYRPRIPVLAHQHHACRRWCVV